MTKTAIYLVVVGVVGSTLLIAVLVEWVFPVPNKIPPMVTSRASETTRTSISNHVQTPADVASSSASDATAILALAKGASSLPDQTLIRLSGMVNIANALNAPPDKEAWRNALPVARQLMKCPSDCGQQNWLSHFVEMGNYALSDSEAEYRESAKLMVALGRNDAQESDTLARLH